MAGTYEQARAAVIEAAYDGQITEFLRTYNPNWSTVIILPSGMGSQLDRSPRPFQPPEDLPLGQFDPVWMDFGLLFGNEAAQLAIGPDGHDIGDHVIVANGPLRFLLLGNPYDLTVDFFASNDFNVAIFGYDWRRSVSESAAYLEVFIDKLRTRVAAKHAGHRSEERRVGKECRCTGSACAGKTS